jgi:hypothetical protein
MKYNFFTLFNYGYTLKTRYRILAFIIIIHPSILAIEKIQNHFIFEFLFFSFLFLTNFCWIKKDYSQDNSV